MKVIVFVIAVLVIFGIAEVMAQNGIAAKGIAGVVAVILYGVIFHKKIVMCVVNQHITYPYIKNSSTNSNVVDY